MPMTRFPTLTLSLPPWIDELLPDPDQELTTVEEQVGLAIDLARHNVARATGGPFGAAVFDLESGRLLAPGVNLVVTAGVAVAHAEVVALSLAGLAAGSFDLGGPELAPARLVASAEPCAMCFGAIPWSGVRSLACAAREEDAVAVGFDEGPKPATWVTALRDRGIEVVRDVRREEGAAVLSEYAAGGGVIYNGRRT